MKWNYPAREIWSTMKTPRSTMGSTLGGLAPITTYEVVWPHKWNQPERFFHFLAMVMFVRMVMFGDSVSNPIIFNAPTSLVSFFNSFPFGETLRYPSNLLVILILSIFLVKSILKPFFRRHQEDFPTWIANEKGIKHEEVLFPELPTLKPLPSKSRCFFATYYIIWWRKNLLMRKDDRNQTTQVRRFLSPVFLVNIDEAEHWSSKHPKKHSQSAIQLTCCPTGSHQC